MSSKKLFVFEGQKTEINIIENLAQNFSKTFPEVFTNKNINCAYCTTIYSLYKELSEDEDLDMFMILKEKEFNKEILKDFNRTDFSEIHLFFDYDGHASNADDKKLSKMISLFNEETESGKILISYPMVEALKHFSNTIDFKELKVQAKKRIGYKKIVTQNSDTKYQGFNQYDKNIWIELIDAHLKKMNFIVNDNFSISKNTISQDKIFAKQLEKHINVDATIAVLSAFPVFLFDYYGYNSINNLIKCPTKTQINDTNKA